MTSRERVRRVLRRELPDRLPFNFWMDRDRMAELDRRLGADFRVTHYGADVVETFHGISFFPDFARNAVNKNDGKTSWRVKFPVENAAALVGAAYPDPDTPAFYAGIRADREKHPACALFAMVVTPLDILFDQIGMEQLFYDMTDSPEFLEEALERIARVLLSAVEHIAACDVDAIYFAGDICSSRGALMSESMLRRFCFGPLRKLIDRAHTLGLPVLYHTDGYVMDLLPLFAEYGIDGINPLQASAGNDPAAFARACASQLLVYGGIDNCFIIPDGTVSEVRSHIRHLFETLGQNGGLIASSHDIPSYCPMENLEAMVDEIRRRVY
ncbi:MAG: hypothetical protein LBJ11_03905 [Oscillospiraceae bacterium]|jgi:uroporphyrinogen-III decarboxylase|nr:hypothetical protein [Oscillospiraceae bacterium]